MSDHEMENEQKVPDNEESKASDLALNRSNEIEIKVVGQEDFYV